MRGSTASTQDAQTVTAAENPARVEQPFRLPGPLRVMNTAYRQAQSGRCLEVAGASSSTNGTAVVIWDCNGQANQQWTRQ